MAQNTKKTDYVACAEQLEKSIKRCMPDANVTIITTDKLPYGDLAPNSDWKLINDWQVYDASPYEYTIKLEADMIIPESIDYWWDVLMEREVVVCTTIRDYKGEVSETRTYRQFLDDNKLPDVYNAITYFRKGDGTAQFFKVVRHVFEHWDEWKEFLKCNPNEQCTTDWAYSLACFVLGVENTTLPGDLLSMVHMKRDVNGLIFEDWTKELTYEFGDTVKINTIPQRYPFHYHIKDFCKELKKNYG